MDWFTRTPDKIRQDFKVANMSDIRNVEAHARAQEDFKCVGDKLRRVLLEEEACFMDYERG